MRNVKAIADKSEVLQRIIGSPQMDFPGWVSAKVADFAPRRLD
jgi:hypothetical protein